jgi:hypothetical protein
MVFQPFARVHSVYGKRIETWQEGIARAEPAASVGKHVSRAGPDAALHLNATALVV